MLTGKTRNWKLILNIKLSECKMEESNWINQLTMGIVGIQHILEDVRKYSTKNDSVKQSYDEPIYKVKDAREAIHRFAAIYNRAQ